MPRSTPTTYEAERVPQDDALVRSLETREQLRRDWHFFTGDRWFFRIAGMGAGMSALFVIVANSLAALGTRMERRRPGRPNRRMGLAVACLVLAACDAPGQQTVPSSRDATVRDSAGITIVESGVDAPFPAPWSVAAQPHWVVGELEGDPKYLLSRVAGALELHGRRVVIANGGTNELRVYDRQGQWIQTLGGEGEGPGEFQYIRALAPCHPGGFVAFDLNWQKNAYLTDGTFVSKTTLQAPSGVSPYELACDDRGNLLVLGWGRVLADGPIIGFHDARDRLVLTGDDGEVRTDFGERLVSERIGSARGSRPHPAGRSTVFAVHDGRVIVGDGRSFQIEVWTLDGRLERLIRGPALDLEVTDSLTEAYLEQELGRAEDPDRRAALRSAIGAWEWPETVPAFTDLRVDEEGIVWLKRFSLDRDRPEVWSLMSTSEGYPGDVELAPGQRLLSFADGAVLVVMRDDLDVERVGKLEVAAPSPP